MRGGYSDVNWFVRAARVAPVIAGAALLGGMIGGFAMFAIDSALTWEPSTREPASQPRPDARAENQTSAGVAQQTTKPVRIVGGAIPDPSAGMSAPPPAPQQRGAAAPAQSPAQISSQLLTPKPLGPASQLQPQTTTATAGPTASSPQQNRTANQAPAPMQGATVTTQPTRWPDALSRAHQNGANAASANTAQQQTAPPPAAAQPSERAAGNNGDADRKQASGDRAATSAAADDQDRGNTRHGRHSRRHWRGDDDVSATSSSPRQDARAYDRLYDSYGNRRDRPYGNTRERSYGGASGDQDDAASRSGLSRSEMRRFGHDTRYQRRWQPDDSDRNQAFEGRGQRSEPFWGGGYRDDD
jgi:hypothetical protein